MIVLKKIISGGQTGADRAGVVAALWLGLEPGGTVPKGCLTENGPLSGFEMARYNFVECEKEGYRPRTKENIQNSDGTVLFGDITSPGSRATKTIATELKKPLIINPTKDQFLDWLDSRQIGVLNVAGNRESVHRGVYTKTLRFLVEALAPQDVFCPNCLRVYPDRLCMSHSLAKK